MAASLHVEAVGGVAGDMLLAALLDLAGDPTPVEAAFASLALPGLALRSERVEVGGVKALSVRSLVAAPEPAFRHLDEILALIDQVRADEPAKALARRIFHILGEAESAVHGGAAGHVHLHEVGQLDSILDVLGIAVVFAALGSPAVTCGPLPSGHGQVRSAHGTLNLPAPAVRVIAETARLPLVPAPLVGETVTPTGIAALAALVQEVMATPPEGASRVGVGAGQRRFGERPNIVRVYGYGMRP